MDCWRSIENDGNGNIFNPEKSIFKLMTLTYNHLL